MISILVVTCLAVVSPGPDFAMTLRNSVRYGRSSGLLTALGIACGVSVHVSYTIFGFAYLLIQNTWLLDSMKIVGAGYLVWVGLSSFLPKRNQNDQIEASKDLSLAGFAAFRNGFLCNALNPKTALFFIAVFTQVVSPETSLIGQLSIGVFIAIAHLIWFAFVAVLLTHNQLETLIVKSKSMIEKITGACLLGLGIKLLFHTT